MTKHSGQEKQRYAAMALTAVLLFAMAAVRFFTGEPGKAAGGFNTVAWIISAVLLTGLSALILYKYMMDYLPEKHGKLTDYIFIATLTLTAALSICIVEPWMPEAVAVFWALSIIATLYDEKLSFMVSVVLTALFYLMSPHNPYMLLMILLGGIVQARLVSKTTQRSSLSMMGLVVAGVNFLLSATLNVLCMLYTDGAIAWLTVCKSAGIIALNSFISIMLLIGLLPLVERLTGSLTAFRLQELSNPNHPLLKRLMIEAPGTYHHSMMVGNLAEAAAEAIDANVSLARVASYYHDVGKLKKPEYFIENINGTNPHDLLEPEVSKKIIEAHVKEGDELARKYKLPREIRDIIKQHHGNTLISYFYHKAVADELSPADITEDDYRYGGPRPSTKEAAIVMLADCVEAAVRALPEKCVTKTKCLIRNIIAEKVNDGQLDETDISLKDLKKIQESFESVICGYYHERVEYPEISGAKDGEENE